FNIDFVKAPRARLRAIVEAVTATLVVAAAIAACIAWRVVAAVLANHAFMEELRQALVRAGEAMGMAG
ncbi:MAG: hypothetical protein ACXWG6_11440, partial [Usitatibacter sp.]